MAATNPKSDALIPHFTERLNAIKANITKAEARRVEPVQATRLVAVGKTKPVEDIIALYKCGQIHFGENYVAELISKANDAVLMADCPNIQWHFIGHLQSNKVTQLLKGVKNLSLLETVHSKNLASALNSFYNNLNLVNHKDVNAESGQLSVLVQVNTSGEEDKSGVTPEKVKDLVSHIIEECHRLKFRGLMTIGADRTGQPGPNPDFVMLTTLRETICTEFGLDPATFTISMGMSGDYEEAIELGSTNVRVGSVLFGDRSYAKKL